MAIAYINGSYNQEDSGSGQTSIAAASLSITTGNAIVIGVYTYSADPATPTDTAGNIFTKLGTYLDASNRRLSIWLALNVIGNAANVVTSTFASSNYPRIMVMQLSGVGSWDTSFSPDGNSDASSPYTSTADSTQSDGEWIVGIFDCTGNGPYTDYGSSVVRVNTAGAWYDACLATALVSTAGSASVQVGGTGVTTAYIYTKALKPAASIEQEGFRPRNDDGTEATATWKADQDTNITLAADTAFRLRFLLKATGNPDSINAQAEARVEPSGGAFGAWGKIN